MHKEKDDLYWLGSIAKQLKLFADVKKEYRESGMKARTSYHLSAIKIYENIGETIRDKNKISEEFKVRHPEIDYSAFSSRRNVTVHEYDRVSEKTAEAMIKDLNALNEKVLGIYQKLGFGQEKKDQGGPALGQ